MHVVIPVRPGVNGSLPTAIATIAWHTDLIPVLIGHNPGIPADHIATLQGRDKFANQALAMLTALDTAWISDPFVWSNDDIYWTRPAAPIRWALGDLADDAGTSKYQRRKQHTRQLLLELGLPTYDYESHTPLPIDKTEMRQALQIGGTMRSTYGNLTGAPDRIAPDVKLRSRHDHIPDTEWISTAQPSLIPSTLAAP